MPSLIRCGSAGGSPSAASVPWVTSTIACGVSIKVPSRSSRRALSTAALSHGGRRGSTGSVEIVRADLVVDRVVDAPEAVALHAGDAVVLLQAALDDEQRAGQDGAAVLLERFRVDDDVRDAGFVLQREEDESLRGARALADDAEPRGADALPAAQAGQLARGVDADRAELLALERDRMRAYRHAGAAQIRGDAVAQIHVGQRAAGAIGGRAGLP